MAAPIPIDAQQNACIPVYPTLLRLELIGFPVRDPKLDAKYTMPVRTPMSRMSEICATTAGVSEMKDPEPKPKQTLKAMVVARAPGSQRAGMRIVVKVRLRIMTLNRPKRSARKPAATRPKALLVVSNTP